MALGKEERQQEREENEEGSVEKQGGGLMV